MLAVIVFRAVSQESRVESEASLPQVLQKEEKPIAKEDGWKPQEAN